ncbi:MAG: HD domain-containing protein [Butyricicoccus sp.]|nr:HD domain-containing protein [Butyricicoccus sp.]
MDSEFEQITCDILADPLFQETRSFVHHGGENSVYNHSVATARVAFSLAHRFGLSEEGIRSVTRAALLHDFFGYDWHSDWFKGYLSQFSGWQRLRHMHAFIHGDIAAERAQERFGLTERQRAAIASHMFPLAFSLPRSSEAWIITLADKIVASREMTQAVGYYAAHFFRKYFPVTQ